MGWLNNFLLIGGILVVGYFAYNYFIYPQFIEPLAMDKINKLSHNPQALSYLKNTITPTASASASGDLKVMPKTAAEKAAAPKPTGNLIPDSARTLAGGLARFSVA